MAVQKPNADKLREMSALWLGKILLAAARAGGRGGSTLPGRAAGRVAPGLLPALAGRVRGYNLLVTGTNGKTTTAYLVAGINRLAGREVLHNRSGSNLLWGIASAFVESSSWLGGMAKDLGVLEADEGAFPAAVRALRPGGVVVTNIFQDQLDRYGEVDRIRDMIQAGLREMRGGFVVLNADDPLVAGLRCHPEARVVTYGLDLNLPAGYRNPGWEVISCPECGSPLAYSVVYLAHLGRYRCPSCTFRRPVPTLRLVEGHVNPDAGFTIIIKGPGAAYRCRFPLPGVYNLYNALAAAACAYAQGLQDEYIAAGLQASVPAFGRMEQLVVGKQPVLMGLIKNAAGANAVLRTFLERPGRFNLLLAINDHYADGTDVSWLWDVDFELLAQHRERVGAIVAGGTRAADMAVRIKYAGLEPSLAAVSASLGRALEHCLQNFNRKEPLYIMPSYTAMLALRRILTGTYNAAPYREE